MRTLSFLLFITICFSCKKSSEFQMINTSQNLTTNKFELAFENANVAFKDSNFVDYLKECKKIYDFSPYDPRLTIIYADALWKNGNKSDAKKILNQLVRFESPAINSWLKSDEYSSFKKIDNYSELLGTSELKAKPVNTSEIAYIIPEKDIIPEGVAYDKKSKKLFVSSIYKRKILAIDSNGNISDFIKSGESGISSVIGMEIDAERRELWACSACKQHTIDSIGMDIFSGIYKFDLETGKLIKKYLLKDTSERLINDITIHHNGTAFITESSEGKVYMIQPEKDSLELFIDSDYYCFANGITLSEDGKFLFVGYFSGIDRINLLTSEIIKLKVPANISLGRIDGLAFYNSSLIANQPTILNGVYQYFLNENSDSITGFKVIEKNNPLFEFPTTGEIAGDTFYYIANAQLRRFNENGTIFPEEKLDSVYILKANID